MAEIQKPKPDSVNLNWNERLDRAETEEDRSQIFDEWSNWLASKPDDGSIDTRLLFPNVPYIEFIPTFI